jgi:hypothetical protein
MHSDTLPIREPCCNFADNTSEIVHCELYSNFADNAFKIDALKYQFKCDLNVQTIGRY